MFVAAMLVATRGFFDNACCAARNRVRKDQSRALALLLLMQAGKIIKVGVSCYCWAMFLAMLPMEVGGNGMHTKLCPWDLVTDLDDCLGESHSHAWGCSPGYDAACWLYISYAAALDWAW